MIAQIDLETLRAKLRENAEQVCRHLLPNGKKEGLSWRCGNVHGDPGRSLDVALEGENAGLWFDHSNGEKGDLLRLWELNRGVGFLEAVRQCADFLGMTFQGSPHDRSQCSGSNVAQASNRPTEDPAPLSPALDWDACVGRMTQAKCDELMEWRGYSPEIVAWLIEQKLIGLFRGGFAFPVHDKDGNVVNIHYRRPDGGWAYAITGKGSSALVIGDLARASYVLVFESQWDAIAVGDKLEAWSDENIGRYAIIVTRGAGSNTDLSEYGIKRFIACPQSDPDDKRNERTGRTPADDWLHRIVSSLPDHVELAVFRTPKEHEDANAWIMDEQPDHVEVFQKVIDQAEFKSPSEYQEVIPSSESADDDKIPAGVFPVPAGEVSYSSAAERIFPVIAKSETMFIRGGKVIEVASDEDGTEFFEHVTEERFCGLVEKHGHRVARREVISKNGMMERVVWRNTNMPKGAASVLLTSSEARMHLPKVRQLVGCEIITPEGQVLGKGYHRHAGGTYVSRACGVVNVPLDVATQALLGLLKDFDFTTEADRSRAVAALLSPAMKMGGLIDDDFPLDVAEADQSQSGKTYRQKTVATLYGEIPTAITSTKGGVGGLDESVSAAMIRGRPFINLDNIRGRVDSCVLEEGLRGAGRVSCRALRVSADVDARPFIWQLSTNGAEFSRDLANRSIITRIRKRPQGYRYAVYPEGDLRAHVEANRGLYLGSVFTVIRAWIDAGRPRTDDPRHDFRDWTQSMDWIIQNVFGLPPLLDGHAEEQLRTANPALQWLRDICHHAKTMGRTDRLFATDFAEIGEDGGIELPGNRVSSEPPATRVGKILGQLYRDSEGRPLTVDGHVVSRFDYRGSGNKTKMYSID